jgi:hypothetical protein
VYRREIVTDGNFKAQHVDMGMEENDVALTDGQGYFVKDSPFKNHLETAVDIKQVGVFDNFGDVWILNLFVESDLRESQGRKRNSFWKEKFRCDWRGCMCLCQTWLLHSTHDGRFPEGREVQ